MLSRVALPIARRTAVAAQVAPGKGTYIYKTVNVLVMYGIFNYFSKLIIATKK